MKKKFVVLGLVGAMALGTCTVSAASGTRNISATFRNIKIVVDGKQVSTSAEPFIYNGTTYLPIRAVGEAVGKEVSWDAGTNTVYLGEVPASAQQPAAPETPAASSDLPILQMYWGHNGEKKENIQGAISVIHSGKASAHFIVNEYMNLIDYLYYVGESQLARAACEEAQIAIAYTANDPDSAREKANFEAVIQDLLSQL